MALTCVCVEMRSRLLCSCIEPSIPADLAVLCCRTLGCNPCHCTLARPFFVVFYVTAQCIPAWPLALWGPWALADAFGGNDVPLPVQVHLGLFQPAVAPGESLAANTAHGQPAGRVVQACHAYQSSLLQASFPAFPAPVPLDMQQASELIASAMESCHALQQSAWAPATLSVRQHAVTELSAWLSQLPAEWGLSLETISPELLGAYVTQQWLPKHAGTLLADGSKIAAPSSLSAMLSHLSTHFKQQGRLGLYGLMGPQHGNPVESFHIEHVRKAYSRSAWQRGYEEASAVPMPVEKLQKLLDLLDADSLLTGNVLKAMLMQRDTVAFLYAWECGQRGKEVGQLQLADVQDVYGNPCLGLPMEEIMKVQEFVVAPSGTKTRRMRRAGVLPVQLCSDQPLHYCLLRRLHMFVAHFQAIGHPIIGYLFRPLSEDSSTFEEQGMTSGECFPLSGLLPICFLAVVHAHLNGSLMEALRCGLFSRCSESAYEAALITL